MVMVMVMVMVVVMARVMVMVMVMAEADAAEELANESHPSVFVVCDVKEAGCVRVLANAAGAAAEMGSAVPLAVVEPDEAKKFDALWKVVARGTLPRVLVTAHGLIMPYAGDRSAISIVKYIIRLLESDAGATRTTAKQSFAALATSSSSKAALLAVLPPGASREHPLLQALDATSHVIAGRVGLAYTTDAEVAEAVGVPEGVALALVTPDRGVVAYSSEAGSDGVSAQSIVDFAAANDWRLVGTLSRENAHELWDGLYVHDTGILWINGTTSPGAASAISALFEAAPDAYDADATHPVRHLVVDLARLPEAAGPVTLPESLPAYGIFQAGLQRRVWLDGRLTTRSMLDFIVGYTRGEFGVDPRSAPRPAAYSVPTASELEADPAAAVVEVVHDSYAEVVADDSETNMLLVYVGTPCAGCATMLPIFDDLAAQLALRGPPRIRLAVYDLASNDMPASVKVQGRLPLFVVHPAGPHHEQPIVLEPENGRVQDILLNFLRRNADTETASALATFELENHDPAIAARQAAIREAATGAEK
ncbi:uncharacterized protein AMSG_09059 [Thecamonas trahens ATCC 50062]|uniref:Thioredoxin domain-containing protein n=1 Tax=Thecamonas trahens ATCC 50062 TaxID=461836 RepID=A0A0L0DLH5_THETB|nr:hypothetical protein AMSG_09059 [Thecamonas trahens ATCC 50062]KNC52896.1 hypothetical protein AMSG_09059 [Thecamonas trahens ATCC 50062]|eukprot:XP_013754991.1 hypothetical protein AMSG_09059 [Thecamonas trahens ATCC 50062]